MKVYALLLAGTGLAWAGMAQAADDVAAAGDAGGQAADFHEDTSAEIVVTAPFQRSRGDALSSVSVLQGAELARDSRPTLGETLQRQPGVSATSFGPNASRPVLRGFQGDRIRVLTDGIGSIDVSNTSADHAVIINPLLAERVEVLRGPQSLLYGSSAIGGVVNVLDKRIPRSIPDEAVHADAILGYGSAADEKSGAAAIDVPLGSMFVVHADGSYLDTDDLRIGGHVLSRDLREQAAASADPDVRALADLKDRLPNSASRTWQAGVGAALITEDGSSLGLSYSRYDSLYGIPLRYSLDPDAEVEAPRLDVKQDRIDVRAEVQTGGGLFQTIRLRGGYAKYRHFELEEDGAVGTAFYNDGYEGRLELVQQNRGGWTGAIGLQGMTRDFDVVGEEAFLPKNETEQFGLFTLQEVEAGPLKFAGGARIEHSRLQSKPTEGDLRFPAATRSFDTLSASGGASYALAEGWRIGLNLSRTVRAPSAEELFANGAHAGTEAYELGNPDFRKERSTGVEAILRGRGAGYSIEASAFHNWIDNYIYDTQVVQSVCEAAAAPSGRTVDLPCFQAQQAKARYYGAEIEGTVTLGRVGNFDLVADALADVVRARIVGTGPAPRIPAFRVLGGIEAQGELVDARIEAERVARQNRTAAFESETPGYTLVNASLSVTPWGKAGRSFVLSANNLFDVTARRHASVLKDFAPLSGRDVRVTARVAF